MIRALTRYKKHSNCIFCADRLHVKVFFCSKHPATFRSDPCLCTKLSIHFITGVITWLANYTLKTTHFTILVFNQFYCYCLCNKNCNKWFGHPFIDFPDANYCAKSCLAQIIKISSSNSFKTFFRTKILVGIHWVHFLDPGYVVDIFIIF